jgi:hypothetical protein
MTAYNIHYSHQLYDSAPYSLRSIQFMTDVLKKFPYNQFDTTNTVGRENLRHELLTHIDKHLAACNIFGSIDFISNGTITRVILFAKYGTNNSVFFDYYINNDLVDVTLNDLKW